MIFTIVPFLQKQFNFTSRYCIYSVHLNICTSNIYTSKFEHKIIYSQFIYKHRQRIKKRSRFRKFFLKFFLNIHYYYYALSFALIISAVACIRGTRVSLFRHASETNIELGYGESRLFSI